jgi:hypothetical protein
LIRLNISAPVRVNNPRQQPASTTRVNNSRQ